MSSTKEGGGSAKKWSYSIILFSKMGNKGEGGAKTLKKMGDIIYGQPQILKYGR